MDQSFYKTLDFQFLERLREMVNGQANQFVDAQAVANTITIEFPEDTLELVLPIGRVTLDLSKRTLRLVEAGEEGAAFIDASILRLWQERHIDLRRATNGQLQVALAS